MDKKYLNGKYVADFKATGAPNYEKHGEVEVYLWFVKSVSHPDNVTHGTDLESFMFNLSMLPYCKYVYFHNLDYYLTFIEEHLLYNGFKHVSSANEFRTMKIKTYNVLRSELNEVYGCTIMFENGHKVQLMDSMKLFPQSIEALAEIAGFKKHLVCDEGYWKNRYIDVKNYNPFDHMEDTKDMGARVETIITFLKKHFRYYNENEDHYISQVHLTRSAYAFNDLMNFTEKKYGKDFYELFPKTSVAQRKEMNPSYNGGLVYVKEMTKDYVDDSTPWLNENGVVVGDGYTIDANSEFPYVMTDKYFPIGEPVEYEGHYKKDDEYPLFIQEFKCNFELKEDGFPMLPKSISKGNKPLKNNDGLKDGINTLMMCDVDLKHFLKNYNVSDVEFIKGWKFKREFAPFKEFIEGKNEEKMAYQKEGKMVDRFLVKLDMVSCYGKFAQKVSRRTKSTCFRDGVQYYELSELKERKENYFPMAVFISAYGRDHLLNAAYKVGHKRVMYMDTDSLHVYGTDIPKGIRLSSSALGYWKVENEFSKAVYVKDKLYMEETKSGEVILKASGITDEGKKGINRVEMLKEGMEFNGMYQKKLVRGGCIYVTVTKTIKLDSVEDFSYSEIDLDELPEIPKEVMDVINVLENYDNYSMTKRIKMYKGLNIQQDTIDYLMNDPYLSDLYLTFKKEVNRLEGGLPVSSGMRNIEITIRTLIDKYSKTNNEMYIKILKGKVIENVVFQEVIESNEDLMEIVPDLIHSI